MTEENGALEKLAELKILLNGGLLTEDEYATLVKELKFEEKVNNSKSKLPKYIVPIVISALFIITLIGIKISNNNSNSKQPNQKNNSEPTAQEIEAAKAWNDSLIHVAAEQERKRNEAADYDGNKYNTVKIGEQTWIKENLNVSHFRNGDIIPEVQTEDEWKEAGLSHKPAWCYHKNDPNNAKELGYGKLYNWWAVTDERGLAPSGFHIPNEDEWHVFLHYLGNEDDQWSTVVGEKLVSENGFNAIKAGMRSDRGYFSDMDRDGNWWRRGYWWTSSNGGCLNPPCDNYFAYYFELKNENTIGGITSSAYNQNSGMSVRCIKGEVDEAHLAEIKKQAKIAAEQETRISGAKKAVERQKEEKETKNAEPKTYLTDGQTCKWCGMGHYDNGFCNMCGAASGENAASSKKGNCDVCSGKRYIRAMNGDYKICPACKGTGKQTY